MGNRLMLTIEQRALLDRLYNLKGEDSTVLLDINKNIEQNKTDFTVLSEEAKDLENQKKSITTKRNELDVQYTKILEDLKGIKRKTYGTLLDEADEEFDPEEMIVRIKEKIPERIQNIDVQISEFQENIATTKGKISENEIEARELENKITDALQVQDRLINLVEETLHGNGSITRDSVQELLLSLGFVEDETIELGKMILFPQGTLSLYDEEDKNKKNTAIVEEDSFLPIPEVALDDDVTLENNVISFDEEVSASINTPEIIPTIEIEPIEEVVSEPVAPAVNEIEAKLKKNIEYLKSINIKKEVIKQNEQVLNDDNLVEKCDFFLEIGKTSEDLENSFDILLAYSVNDLKSLKNVCDANDVDIAIIPLQLLKRGLTTFFMNLDLLASKGIVLDKTEMTKNIASLFVDTALFQNNLEMFDNYQYKLDKKNGRVAIQALTQDSEVLIRGIDAITEVGEEQFIIDNPDKLTCDLVTIANRMNYFKNNNVPIKNEAGVYYEFLYDQDEFDKLFEGIEVDTTNSIPSKTENYKLVYNVMGNSKLLDEINLMNLNSVYLDNDLKNESTYFELINCIKSIKNLENGEHSYKLGNLLVSKERLERNLLYLMNKGISNSKELVLIALVFNSIYNESEMNDVVTLISNDVDGGLI